MNIWNIFLGMAGLLLMSGQSQAACRLKGNPYGSTSVKFDINIGTILGAASASVGSVLATFTQNAPDQALINKTNYLGCQVGDMETFKPTLIGSTNVAGYPNVYSTNIRGIGYRLTYSDGTTNAPAEWRNTFGIPGSTTKGGVLYFPPGQFKFELIKTADNIGYGELSVGEYGSDRVPGYQALQINVKNGGFIQNVGCTVDADSKNKAVTLNSLATNKFTGIGDSQGEKPFNLKVTCPAEPPNLKIQFDGIEDSSKIAGTLALSNDSTASGVGIQLLHGEGQPVQLGKFESPTYKTQPKGQKKYTITMDFSARYIQTKPYVKPGNANSTASFTLQYN
ncbi:fimbrial protein [Collimonas pratensis]|uniref:Fimbrial family protein n=1 Tax=Collimonas pratensis TaxID=279113 RepID=A0A127Q5I1_9BURK|nr:fimbrial protein [Collimonas pratensis]AMP05328.1 fimbrial family protein [Collimonas pratensis]